MIRLRHKLLLHMLRLCDLVVLAATAVAIFYWRPDRHGIENLLATRWQLVDLLMIGILLAGWGVVFESYLRYHADRLVALNSELQDVIKAAGLATLWMLAIGWAFGVMNLTLINLAGFFSIVAIVAMASRVILRIWLLRVRKFDYNFRYLLIIGVGEDACQLAQQLDARPELGYQIVGFVAESSETFEESAKRVGSRWRLLGVLDHLRHILTRERVDEMMICLPWETRFIDISRIIQRGRDLGVVVRLMPRAADGDLLTNLHVEEFNGHRVVTLFREQMLGQLLAKRLIDVGISLLVLTMLSPLMALIAVLIKLTSPGPVLFVQHRVGMNQRQFRLYKFRSMVADAEERKFAIAALNERDGPAFKMANDPRTTPLGRFLRKTSLDELPQLYNVLHGEMSLVGPRPPLPEEVRRYAWLFRKRLSVKPGVTCIWQVSGRNEVSFARWMEMDHEYIENWSLWLDFKIMINTIPAVLFTRGAS